MVHCFYGRTISRFCRSTHFGRYHLVDTGLALENIHARTRQRRRPVYSLCDWFGDFTHGTFLCDNQALILYGTF